MTEPLAVKFVDGSSNVIEGLGLPFGGPAHGKDLTGTYFTPKTDFALKWFPDNVRPLLFEHGLDGEVQLDPVGTFSVKSWDDRGGWVQAKLDEASEYAEAVKDLVKKGALLFSSGSVDHLYTTDKSGAIRTWPLVEMSLTTRAANPDQPVPAFRSLPKLPVGHYAIKSTDAVTHLRVLGIAMPDAIKADMPTSDINDLPDSDFAYIEPGGKKDDEGKTTPRSLRHFPIHDAAHVRNALARAPQSPFGGQAMPKIKAAAEKFGIDEPAGKSVGMRALKCLDSQAALILSQVLDIRRQEADEEDQAAVLDSVIEGLMKYIDLERAEPEDDDHDNGPMGAYLSMDRAIKAGARNSASDQAHIDAIHTHTAAAHAHAMALGASNHSDGEADQPDDGDSADDDGDADQPPAGKSLRTEPAQGLAVKAGATAVPMSDDELAEFRRSLSLVATKTAEELLGRR